MLNARPSVVNTLCGGKGSKTAPPPNGLTVVRAEPLFHVAVFAVTDIATCSSSTLKSAMESSSPFAPPMCISLAVVLNVASFAVSDSNFVSANAKTVSLISSPLLTLTEAIGSATPHLKPSVYSRPSLPSVSTTRPPTGSG